jgi:hypothetical protein
VAQGNDARAKHPCLVFDRLREDGRGHRTRRCSAPDGGRGSKVQAGVSIGVQTRPRIRVQC